MRNGIRFIVGMAIVCAFGPQARASWPECGYGAPSDFVTGPLNGTVSKIFALPGESGRDPSNGAHPLRYKRIVVCERPEGSRYILVTDGYMGVTSPPQEVLQYYEKDFWDHYVVNTAHLGRGEAPASSLHLVAYGTHAHLNGNPDRMWVFESNSSVIGGMPILQATLIDPTAKR